MIEKLQQAIENESWNITIDGVKLNVEVETEIEGCTIYVDIMRNIHAGEIKKYLANKYNVNVSEISCAGDTILVIGE